MRTAPFTHIIVSIAFLANSSSGPLPLAQADEFYLPSPGVKVDLSPGFNPPILKGIKVHPDDPFQFDFILDEGDKDDLYAKNDAARLIKYFLASLTIPEKDLWVNLSPYEKDRIIPQSFGMTEMGRDLLAEDYMLKQITASLIYPEGGTGKRFWKRIYEESAKKFGTTNIPVNTFNKVWILPEKAVVYENVKNGTAYVVESKLKVMLEEDYLSLEKHSENSGNGPGTLGSRFQVRSGFAKNILQEIVIPELTREVNEDRNFAQLRQVYNSLILATWYKKKIKDSILEEVYRGKNKTAGVQYTSTVIPMTGPYAGRPQKLEIKKRDDVELIYQRYLQAFKKGVYNYIKEDADPLTHETVPRKYFSGGAELIDVAIVTTTVRPVATGRFEEIKANFVMVQPRSNFNDFAMKVNVEEQAERFLKSMKDADIYTLAVELDQHLHLDDLPHLGLKYDKDRVDLLKRGIRIFIDQQPSGYKKTVRQAINDEIISRAWVMKQGKRKKSTKVEKLVKKFENEMAKKKRIPLITKSGEFLPEGKGVYVKGNTVIIILDDLGSRVFEWTYAEIKDGDYRGINFYDRNETLVARIDGTLDTENYGKINLKELWFKDHRQMEGLGRGLLNLYFSRFKVLRSSAWIRNIWLQNLLIKEYGFRASAKTKVNAGFRDLTQEERLVTGKRYEIFIGDPVLRNRFEPLKEYQVVGKKDGLSFSNVYLFEPLSVKKDDPKLKRALGSFPVKDLAMTSTVLAPDLNERLQDAKAEFYDEVTALKKDMDDFLENPPLGTDKKDWKQKVNHEFTSYLPDFPTGEDKIKAKQMSEFIGFLNRAGKFLPKESALNLEEKYKKHVQKLVAVNERIYVLEPLVMAMNVEKDLEELAVKNDVLREILSLKDVIYKKADEIAVERKFNISSARGEGDIKNNQGVLINRLNTASVSLGVALQSNGAYDWEENRKQLVESVEIFFAAQFLLNREYEKVDKAMEAKNLEEDIKLQESSPKGPWTLDFTGGPYQFNLEPKNGWTEPDVDYFIGAFRYIYQTTKVTSAELGTMLYQAKVLNHDKELKDSLKAVNRCRTDQLPINLGALFVIWKSLDDSGAFTNKKFNISGTDLEFFKRIDAMTPIFVGRLFWSNFLSSIMDEKNKKFSIEFTDGRFIPFAVSSEEQRNKFVRLVGILNSFLNKLTPAGEQDKRIEISTNFQTYMKSQNGKVENILNEMHMGALWKEDAGRVAKALDLAMNVNPTNTGGIDLTAANMNLQTKMDPRLRGNDNGMGIKFHLDPAMLAQLQNAPGFVPVIVSVKPLKSLDTFLDGIVNQR